MARALVIVLRESRFVSEGVRFSRYLRDRTDTPVRIISARVGEQERLAGKISCFLRDDPGELRLVAYFGHGAPGKWVGGTDADSGEVLHYRVLTELLAQAEGPTFIINDCCYSDSLGFMLDVSGADETRHGCVNAAAVNEVAYQGFLLELITARWADRLMVPAGTLYVWADQYRIWVDGGSRGVSALREAFHYALFRLRFWLAGWRHRDACQQTVCRWGKVFDDAFFPKR